MDPVEMVDLKSTLASGTEIPSSEPAKTETPSTEVSKAIVEAPIESAKTEPVLYELPDGRKVDPETLTKEWKENFLPDYTRKSQRIAEIEKTVLPTKEEKPYWENPEWAPQTNAQLLQMIDDRTAYKAEQAQKAQEQQQSYIKTLTDQMEAEVKILDPKADINEVYLHANKLKSSDLVAAYKNLVEIRNIEKVAQEKVLKNLKMREADPISTGSQTPSSEGIDYYKVRGQSIQDIRLG